jgi:hypothetical protein
MAKKVIEVTSESYADLGLGLYELGTWELGDESIAGSPSIASILEDKKVVLVESTIKAEEA